MLSLKEYGGEFVMQEKLTYEQLIAFIEPKKLVDREWFLAL